MIFHFVLLFEVFSDFPLAVIVPSLPNSDFKIINCECADEVDGPVSNFDDSNN